MTAYATFFTSISRERTTKEVLMFESNAPETLLKHGHKFEIMDSSGGRRKAAWPRRDRSS